MMFEFPAHNGKNKLKGVISFEAISFEITNLPVAPNSNIMNVNFEGTSNVVSILKESYSIVTFGPSNFAKLGSLIGDFEMSIQGV